MSRKQLFPIQPSSPNQQSSPSQRSSPPSHQTPGVIHFIDRFVKLRDERDKAQKVAFKLKSRLKNAVAVLLPEIEFITNLILQVTIQQSSSGNNGVVNWGQIPIAKLKKLVDRIANSDKKRKSRKCYMETLENSGHVMQEINMLLDKAKPTTSSAQLFPPSMSSSDNSPDKDRVKTSALPSVSLQQQPNHALHPPNMDNLTLNSPNLFKQQQQPSRNPQRDESTGFFPIPHQKMSHSRLPISPGDKQSRNDGPSPNKGTKNMPINKSMWRSSGPFSEETVNILPLPSGDNVFRHDSNTLPLISSGSRLDSQRQNVISGKCSSASSVQPQQLLSISRSSSESAQLPHAYQREDMKL